MQELLTGYILFRVLEVILRNLFYFIANNGK
jgi:hypothetical protein